MPQLPFTFSGQGDEPPPKRPLSPRELAAALRRHADGFGRVTVEGEVRGLSVRQGSGHGYFDIADQHAAIPVFLPASILRTLRPPPAEGLMVRLEGRVGVYEPRGRLQLIVERLVPVGEGILRLAIAERVERLRAEGLTDRGRKRRIPPVPGLVGVATSRDGAALRDVLRTAIRRDPRVHLVLAAAPVQGPTAAALLVRALRRLERHGCSVILLVRGGGSLEDLAPFFDEALARAVANCSVPVVTGVGHETDITLVDHVSDHRAATPTAAAEIAVARRRDLVLALHRVLARIHRAFRSRLVAADRDLRRLNGRLASPLGRLHGQSQRLDRIEIQARTAIIARLRALRLRLDSAATRLDRSRPAARLGRIRARLGAAGRLRPALDRRLNLARAHLVQAELRLAGRRQLTDRHRARLLGLEARLRPALAARLEAARRDLGQAAARLDALSPLAVLGRGYAVATGPDGRALTTAAAVAPGDKLDLRLHHGRLTVRVEPENGGQ